MPLVMLLSLAAIAANIAPGYLLASRALRPPLQYVLKRLGYQLPRVQSSDVTDLLVLLRVTPACPSRRRTTFWASAQCPSSAISSSPA